MDSTAPKMEARAATSTVSPRPSPAEDPFRYGFRERYVTRPDGRKVLEQIPLTPYDLVYPEEGDHVQSLQQFSFLHPEADAIRRHLGKRPHTVVTSDVGIVLRHDGKNCAPDVAVVEGRFDPEEVKGAIQLGKLGARLVFALEAVSDSDKQIEDKDLKTNKERYAKEGVVDYVTVYPVGGRKVKNLAGWHLEDGDYVPIPPDAEGRVYSEQVGLFFRIDTETQELVVVDAATGERLLTSDEEEALRRKAEAEREQEAEARRQAEELAKQEAKARRQSEERIVEDLCAMLGIAWDAERSAQVERMTLAQLEALRQHLFKERSWPAEP